MSAPHNQRPPVADINELDVAAFLCNDPSFFERHPDLLTALRIPHPAGGAVSLVERQVAALRGAQARITKQLANLLDIGRLNDKLADQSHQITLDLLDVTNLAAALALIGERLQRDFAADGVAIRLLARPVQAELATREEFVTDTHQFNKLFASFLAGGRSVCGRLTHAQREYLFGAEADRIASAVLLPIGGQPALGLLAIGSHDATRFHSDQGTVFLDRLAAIVGKVLARHLTIG